MDKEKQNALLALRQRFITESDLGLNRFLEGMRAILPHQSPVERKTWKDHANDLNEAWRLTVKEGNPDV